MQSLGSSSKETEISTAKKQFNQKSLAQPWLTTKPSFIPKKTPRKTLPLNYNIQNDKLIRTARRNPRRLTRNKRPNTPPGPKHPPQQATKKTPQDSLKDVTKEPSKSVRKQAPKHTLIVNAKDITKQTPNDPDKQIQNDHISDDSEEVVVVESNNTNEDKSKKSTKVTKCATLSEDRPTDMTKEVKQELLDSIDI